MTLNVAEQWPDIIAQPLTGELRLRVRGRSMWPTLQPGDEAHVAPVAAEALQPGDWIIIRAPNGPLIHRFLGFTREGELLTKGDAHRAPDPPWPQEALLGRVTAFTRRGITTVVRPHSLAERTKTMWHRVVAGIWQRRRSRRHTLSSVLLALLCLALLFHPLLAAVTLSRFGASVQTDSIKVYWETASEVNMSVFYVLRSLSETGTYSRISNFIPAEGDLGGAMYEYIDYDVQAGTTYYYKLEAVETNGSSEFHGPVSARMPLPGEDATPTPTPSPTATSTPAPTTAAPPPTATPEPFVRFWADQTTLQAGQCATLQWETAEIDAVFLDGVGVPGVSGKTVCPCAGETHVLRVTYRDGSTQDFTVTLNVQGVCTPAPPNSTATPTFPPPTLMPRPNGTAAPTVENGRITPTPQPGAPTFTPAPQTAPIEITEIAPLSPGTPLIAPGTATASPSLATPTLARPLFEGQAPEASSSNWLWGAIGAGGLLILLGGAGIWWMRRRA
ncbi:MAG TPA: S24/S26 family peptidase [Anaerolineae bacterium]|nr:S24/S26 family peptidase [Anaerolineae bacterium]